MATKHHMQNPLKLQFDAWLTQTAKEIAQDRGYASQAARAIGVTRQTMSRWLAMSTPIPAWAAIALRQWVRKNPVRLGCDNAPLRGADNPPDLLGSTPVQNRPSASQPQPP